MFKRLALVTVCIFTGSAAYAEGLDISLGSDTAQIVYLFDSDAQIGIGGSDLGVGVFFNENDDYLLNGSIVVTGNSTGRNRALQLGAGAKLYAGELDIPQEDTVGAVAIGGKVSYVFPSSTPMAITGEIFYAPDITSFGDNENLTEFNIHFDIEIAPTTRFYIGYRNLEVELTDSNVDYELDDSGHVGVRFSF